MYLKRNEFEFNTKSNRNGDFPFTARSRCVIVGKIRWRNHSWFNQGNIFAVSATFSFLSKSRIYETVDRIYYLWIVNLLFLETTSIIIFPVCSVFTMKWAFSIVFSIFVAIALKSLLFRLPIIEIATISKMIRSKNDTRSPIIVRRTGRGIFLISLIVKKILRIWWKAFFSLFYIYQYLLRCCCLRFSWTFEAFIVTLTDSEVTL